MISGPTRRWFSIFLVLAACTSSGDVPLDAPPIALPFSPTNVEGAGLTPSGTPPPIDSKGTPAVDLSDPNSRTPSPTPSLSLSPSPTLASCTRELCVEPGHFLLDRPIAPPGRIWVDPTYRFGMTQNGEREPHHGVEFVNSSGTPVLAAAAGEVVVAGDDQETIYADWPFFYGNLVVLKHGLPGMPEPVFTLYAHLSTVEVVVGEQVAPGQQIGRVGLSGVATGSHLHFEVRLGENRYAAVRNPELWLVPERGEDGNAFGVLAGRIEDGEGQPINIPNLVVERLAAPGGEARWQQYLETYVDPGLIPAGAWGENFALGDLPAGWYRLTFVYRGLQIQEVYVSADQLTRVTFTIGD